MKLVQMSRINLMSARVEKTSRESARDCTERQKDSHTFLIEIYLEFTNI